ncbi:hypothetical protein LNTAR_05036 [Lentisphaera araneosa HTCC2155]|uniref:Transglutaminase-like domain-containing protein n=1 Tax=Lentisphaera araneosa HTCC2155 TaxID=313628 RepID=A6DLJ4_9BACT|nr:transglutaminase-like domain-containing protein [Lentisphaera araneosa]EDM27449.1 hypothetical protein LNTAR_05036 [Lentisphaera araneosa HTCC2155]
MLKQLFLLFILSFCLNLKATDNLDENGNPIDDYVYTGIFEELSPEDTNSEIELLVQNLEHDPLKIFNFVRQNIEFEEYTKSMRSAISVLEARHGNYYDQNILLFTLLKAAGFNADGDLQNLRYAYDSDLNKIWVEVKLNVYAYRGLSISSQEIKLEWIPLDLHIDKEKLKSKKTIFKFDVPFSDVTSFDYSEYNKSYNDIDPVELVSQHVSEYVKNNAYSFKELLAPNKKPHNKLFLYPLSLSTKLENNNQQPSINYYNSFPKHLMSYTIVETYPNGYNSDKLLQKVKIYLPTVSDKIIGLTTTYVSSDRRKTKFTVYSIQNDFQELGYVTGEYFSESSSGGYYKPVFSNEYHAPREKSFKYFRDVVYLCVNPLGNTTEKINKIEKALLAIKDQASTDDQNKKHFSVLMDALIGTKWLSKTYINTKKLYKMFGVYVDDYRPCIEMIDNDYRNIKSDFKTPYSKYNYSPPIRVDISTYRGYLRNIDGSNLSNNNTTLGSLKRHSKEVEISRL